MKKPKMIIFDYGQTLISDMPMDAVKGTRAVLNEAVKNPYNVSAEVVQALADELLKEMHRYGVEAEKQNIFEIHNHIFQNYLYEYFGIEFTKSSEEIEDIFESAAFKSKPTDNIQEFLEFLKKENIRSSVISNISFSGKLLKKRINSYIPTNNFEFIIASSEYIFRKPHRRIFELALRKAELEAQEVWYCGDNAVFDIDGAAASGIFPIWFKGAIEERNKYVPKSDCLEISNWYELIDIIKNIK